MFLLLLVFYRLKNTTNFINLLGTLQFISVFDFFTYIINYIILFGFLFILHTLVLSLTSINILSFISLFYLFPVIFLPIIYLLTYSTNSLLCLGLIQKKSIFSSFVNDWITLISFGLRFFSQYIRILLVVTVFTIFYEYINSLQIYTISLPTKNNFNLSLSKLLITIIRLLFELVDCFFILIIQLNTFFIVLLWLLSFLFILKFNNIFEK